MLSARRRTGSQVLLYRLIILVVGSVLVGWLLPWWTTRQTAVPPAPLSLCSEADIAAAALAPYQPALAAPFITLRDGQFWAGDQPFAVRGVNYYPARMPWRRFLRETDEATLRQDFAFLSGHGLNTLRLFLWHEALFQCPGSGAVPDVAGFARLDLILRLAAEYDLRLIVTLHDMPDLTDYPLYTQPPHSQQQMALLFSRYQAEAAILAWDVRNEGDIDYGTHHAFPARFSRTTVLNWLAAATTQARRLAPQHLLTAGWLYDAEATAPYVDFVSFHHWGSAGQLQDRINSLRAATSKPILLQEFGYSTQRVSEADQAAFIAQNITASETHGLLGWLIWTAFDFPLDATCYPSPCLSPDNAEHYFGLWRADKTPKAAAAVIRP